MSEFLARLADWIKGGNVAARGEGLDTTVSHTWPVEPWITVLAMILTSACIVFIYVREKGRAGRVQKCCLAAIRIGLFGTLLFMMYGWLWHQHRTDLPDIIVVLDDSESMRIVDHLDKSDIPERLQQGIGDNGFSKPTRFALAQCMLLDTHTALLASLESHYNVKFYRIGESSRTSLPTSEHSLTEIIRSSEADGHTSRLGLCLKDIVEAQRGRPTAAIIMFTDGITTEGERLSEAANYARRKSIPLHIVGMGRVKPPRDILISQLFSDDLVFVNDLITFDFKVSGRGFAGEEVAVTLREKGTPFPLDQKTIQIDQDGVPTSVRLTWRPPEKGEYEYEINVETREGEVNTSNNTDTQVVTVRDEAVRVILVQDYPNFEFRFLKNLLARSVQSDGLQTKTIELTTVLHEADRDYASQDKTAQRVFPVSREELFKYDVIIFGDVNPTTLTRSTLDNIASFVTERGGGIIFCAGPRHTPLAYRGSPLETLLPINLESASLPGNETSLDEEFRAKLTTLGLTVPHLQLAETSGANAQLWNELPPLYFLLAAPDVLPATRVFAVHPSRRGPRGANLPLVCMQYVGAGKVVLHCTDEIYRWAQHSSGSTYYARYWLQTLRYLSRSKLHGENAIAEILDQKQEYQRGDPVQLLVRFLDDRFAPAKDDGVTLMLEHTGSRRRQVTLHRNSSHPGIFESTLHGLARGQYRVWMASPTIDGETVSRTFKVVSPPTESTRLEMDKTDLTLAAKTSQGEFYTIESISDLLKRLPAGRHVRIESLPPEPLWNTSILICLFVALLITEWLLRKKLGML